MISEFSVHGLIICGSQIVMRQSNMLCGNCGTKLLMSKSLGNREKQRQGLRINYCLQVCMLCPSASFNQAPPPKISTISQ